jgi:hypothetical protein
MDWIDLAQDWDQRGRSCEHGCEPSSSIKCWDILKWLSDWQLLKNPAAWSYTTYYSVHWVIEQKCCRGSVSFAQTWYVSYFISDSLLVWRLPPTKTTEKYMQVNTCVPFAETHDAHQRHPLLIFMRYPAVMISFLTIVCSPCRILLISIESRLICFDRNATIGQVECALRFSSLFFCASC